MKMTNTKSTFSGFTSCNLADEKQFFSRIKLYGDWALIMMMVMMMMVMMMMMIFSGIKLDGDWAPTWRRNC